MTRALSHPPRRASIDLDEVQHLVLDGVSWNFYEHLLKEIGDRPLRVTFDNGMLEIMSPLPEHEAAKGFIGRMIEMLSFQLRSPMKSLGSTTFRRRDKAKGLEPDECYFFQSSAKVRGIKRWNPRIHPPPDLVVEIDIFSRSIEREPIYVALGVPELWRYDGRSIRCLHLVGGRYVIRKHSRVFPFLEVAALNKFIELLTEHDENGVLYEFLDWVRQNGWIV